MSEEGGFSIDQLMELAGLSVSQAVYKVHPPSQGKNILIACGPGNNGGDGLVCARHLHHYGYAPTIYYPKPTNTTLFAGLQKQLRHLHIPFLSTIEEFASALESADLVIDSLFGFSFRPPVRPPFDTALSRIISSHKPILSVDIPSSWDVEGGPPAQDQLGADFMPRYLISLTAAKPCVRWFKGERHFIGGRFLSEDVAKKYGLEAPGYEGVDQIAEVPVDIPVERL
ncbi:YjeF family domain-containing protein [Rhinocladiella mackenziei CBS 650.93]|uniref:NAD(P)H-hydrate epimerase n=1 Tax=Rhinocladiella mackenziei CBS 650.93 TaxID=1442369 RepID=A0A0D2ITS9_9EURO|nr:YjeF family domain-containing protein [Rhinocladiella mackenziei CBS 650.93]KIX09489.1 YjeF family domain-containing protein [Rhinocladiella mackenziei CBS 650.93]